MENLYIVMPAYNEEDNIDQTVEEWYPVAERVNREPGCQAHLLIINDGSRDQTENRLQQLVLSRPLMQFITKPNSGHGPTLICAYRTALEKGADYIFQTDSDGQTSPDEFDRLWRRRKHYDAIFGSRTRRRDGFDRILAERSLCLLLKIIFGVSIPDANAPFRLMRAQFVREYLPLLPEDYFLPNVMLAVFGAWYHRRIRFVPVSFRPRQAGKNSMDFLRIVRVGVKSVRDFYTFRASM